MSEIVAGVPEKIEKLQKTILFSDINKLEKLLEENKSIVEPIRFRAKYVRSNGWKGWGQAKMNPLCLIDSSIPHFLEKIKLMLEHGADPNARTNVYRNEYGWLSIYDTPYSPVGLFRSVYGAIRGNYYEEDICVRPFNETELCEIQRQLVEYGADIYGCSAPRKVLQSHYGKTLRDGHKKMASRLLGIIQQRTELEGEEGVSQKTYEASQKPLDHHKVLEKHHLDIKEVLENYHLNIKV